MAELWQRMASALTEYLCQPSMQCYGRVYIAIGTLAEYAEPQGDVIECNSAAE